MKLGFSKIHFLSIFFLVFLIATMGCKKDGNTARIVTMKVASKLIKVGPRPPASPDNPALIYNMSITEEATNETYGLNLGQIEGFNYVEGYEYVLKVSITPRIDPPADGDAETYKLIEVLSKTQVGTQ